MGQMSASVRLSSTAAAAMMVDGIFVCSGTAPPYSLLAERQPALHRRPWSSVGSPVPSGARESASRLDGQYGLSYNGTELTCG